MTPSSDRHYRVFESAYRLLIFQKLLVFGRARRGLCALHQKVALQGYMSHWNTCRPFSMRCLTWSSWDMSTATASLLRPLTLKLRRVCWLSRPIIPWMIRRLIAPARSRGLSRWRDTTRHSLSQTSILRHGRYMAAMSFISRRRALACKWRFSSRHPYFVKHVWTLLLNDFLFWFFAP